MYGKLISKKHFWTHEQRRGSDTHQLTYCISKSTGKFKYYMTNA